MATKLIFIGTDNNAELDCFINDSGELFMEIDNDKNESYFKGYVCLDKETALSLRDRLDELINEME